jgi:hypothetical protein
MDEPSDEASVATFEFTFPPRRLTVAARVVMFASSAVARVWRAVMDEPSANTFP